MVEGTQIVVLTVFFYNSLNHSTQSTITGVNVLRKLSNRNIHLSTTTNQRMVPN